MNQIQHDSKINAAPANTNDAALVKLTDAGLTLADSNQEIRGRKAVDRHGDEIGHVSSLFIDEAERKVRMIEIRAGGFFGIGERHFLIPVDAIASVSTDEVHVNASRQHVAGSPPYNPDLVEEPAQLNWEPFYGYYGLSPYWGNGYMYPTFPLTIEQNHRESRSQIPRD